MNGNRGMHLLQAALLCCTMSIAGMAVAAEPIRPASGQAEAAPNAVADTDTAKTAAAKAAIKAGATPVAVELEGTDTAGARLSLELKEILNSGTLFMLTEKETPKIRVLISTAPEFECRPEAGSAYSVVWVYYERASTFNSYLAREVGTVSAAGVSDLAARLAERTAGIAAKYSYIFEK